jgi:hypothetical protein
MTGEHYEIQYDSEGYVRKVVCRHCDWFITFTDVKPTRTGHRWPRMVIAAKRHLRDNHGINLWKRAKEAKQ